MAEPGSSANGRHMTERASGAGGVAVAGETIVIKEFVETDRTVVGLVRDSDDAEAAVHQLLGVGGG